MKKKNTSVYSADFPTLFKRIADNVVEESARERRNTMERTCNRAGPLQSFRRRERRLDSFRYLGVRLHRVYKILHTNDDHCFRERDEMEARRLRASQKVKFPILKRTGTQQLQRSPSLPNDLYECDGY